MDATGVRGTRVAAVGVQFVVGPAAIQVPLSNIPNLTRGSNSYFSTTYANWKAITKKGTGSRHKSESDKEITTTPQADSLSL